MRKLLLSLFALAGVLSLSAATEVSFDPTTDKTTENTELSITKDGVTIAITDGDGRFNNGTDYRVYKNATFTVSSESTITSIVLTASSANPLSGFAAVTGFSDGTWTGGANEVSFVASNKQVRLTSVTVTIDGSVTPVVVAPVPVLDPASGTFTENFNVTVTWDNAEDFDCYYTLDGVDMGNLNGSGSTVAIEGIGDHTLEVYTYNAEATSETVTGTYKIIDPTALGEYAKLTDASALKEGDQVIFVYEGDATSYTLQAGTTGAKRVDGEAITVINNTVDPTDNTAIFTVGGTSGAFTFKEGDYFMNGPASGTNLSFSTSQDGTWAISFTEGGNTRIAGSNGRMLLFNTSSNQFGNYAASNYDNYGKPDLYVKAGQEVAVKTPTLSLESGEYRGAQELTIATETEDASIRYTLDGTDPLEEGATLVEGNVAEVTLWEGAEYSVRAIAVSEAGTSGEVQGQYTINYQLPEVVDPAAATDVTSSSFVANWAEADNAVSYDLYVYEVVEGQGDTEVLNETFEAYYNAESETYKGTPEGWTFENVNWNNLGAANGMSDGVPFGTGSKQGAAITPELGAVGAAVLAFDAAAWNGNSEKLTLTVSVEGAGSIAEGDEVVTLTKQEYNSFEVALSDLAAASKIRISATEVNNNRFFLKNVVVTTSGGISTLLEGYPVNTTETSCEVAGLSPETTYTYSIVAKNAADEESAMSEAVEVTTLSGEEPTRGDINGDGAVDGADVSALLEMVLSGGLTDEQKTVADLTGDGEVDGSDVSALLEIVLTGE